MNGERTHGKIYEGAGGDYFYTPFHMRVDPMERLLLINWKNGEFYKGAEPQWFDDEQHGRGLVVILYRLDNKVDVYYQPEMSLDPRGYQIQGGLGDMVACQFRRARFEIGPEGIDVDIAFADKGGRSIVLQIGESRGKRAGHFSLLAPMGMSIEEPDAMPLLFLYDFSFVKVAGTEVNVSVDGARREMLKLPVPMGGSRVYLTRYCGDPFIAFWNPEMQGPLPRGVVDEASLGEVDRVRYALVENAGHYEIAGLARGQAATGRRPAREVRVSFEPPFPALVALRDGVSLEGSFRIKMTPRPEAGEVGGEWRVGREGNRVRARLHPSEGWQPGEPSLTPRLIFTVARPFKQWPKSYEWTATVELKEGQQPAITSRWARL